MARIQKYGLTYAQPLSAYATFIKDTAPNSQYFRVTEFKETFTGGKNGFLIEGCEHLMQSTEVQIQVLDVGNTEFKYVYFKDPDDQYVSIVETSY